MLSDGNENGKKKNQVEQTFFAHFFTVVVARLQSETS